jgi:formyl-CoA transferase/CoA:oxalate CoA-transferase
MSTAMTSTVVEIASTYATMHAGRLLAESGLPVLRIELDAHPALEALGPRLPDGRNAAYLSANLKKTTIRLDADRAASLIAQLATTGAVFLTDRDEYRELRARNVTCHVHPYRGTTGGMLELPSADVLVQAGMAGAGMTGRIGGAPVPMGFPIGDLAPGMYAAIGVLRGLLEARAQKITIDALDATVSLLTYLGCSFFVSGEDVGFIGSGHPYIVPYGAYTARDGHVIVAAFNQEFWRKLCKMLGRSDLCENPRYRRFTDRRENRDELNALLDDLFRQHTVAEWTERLRAADVPNAPVFSLQQSIEHPVVAARNMVLECDGVPLFESPLADVTQRRAGASGKRALLGDVHATLAALGITEDDVRRAGGQVLGARSLGAARSLATAGA